MALNIKSISHLLSAMALCWAKDLIAVSMPGTQYDKSHPILACGYVNSGKLLAHADEAMYVSKQNGKNGVSSFFTPLGKVRTSP